MNRIRAGFCTVPNPFNLKQISTISLLPQDVDVFVFWTRNARPIIPYLEELDSIGYKYYFQYTVMNNPKEIDPKVPPLDHSLQTFKKLSNQVSPYKIIWRYDPIIFSQRTDVDFHKQTFSKIAKELKGFTKKTVVSIVDIYPKAKKRFAEIANKGINIYNELQIEKSLTTLIPNLVEIALENGIEIASCAEEYDLSVYGVKPGKCIDAKYIKDLFNVSVTDKKDPFQRKECGCVVSKDIGMYDTCFFGCLYCYATQSFKRAKTNYEEHNPDSPSLVGWHEGSIKKEVKPEQGTLPIYKA